MADETENLNISITATDAGASSTTSEVLEIVTRVEAALRQSGAAGATSGAQIAEGAATADKALQAMNVTINVGAGALRKHAESAAEDGNVLKLLADHSATAARGFEVLGLEAEAGAVKLAGLAEVAELVEASFLPLLVIGTIIATLSVGFESLKEGVDAAAELQGQMTSLGTAVKMQGGNWDELSESVRKWAEVQEAATGTDVNEAVASMNRLVVAGASVKDAMYEVSVSEDVAAATHKSLKDVIDLVIEAEAGRGVGLEKLDARLKPLIKNHADLSAVMAQLAKDMSGQAAAAADTYEGAARRLHATWDSFWRMIGESLLPWLTQLMDSLIGFGDELGRFDKGVADFTGSVAHMFMDMANISGAALDVLGSKLEQFFHMAGANDHARMAGANLTAAVKALGIDSSGTGNAFGSAWSALTEDDGARGHKILNDATWQRQHELDAHGTGLDFDPTIGNEKISSTGTSFSDAQYQPAKVDEEAKAQNALDEQLKRVNDSEKALAEGVKLATSAAAAQAAQSAYDAQVLIDLEMKHRILTSALATETTEQSRLEAEHTKAVAAARAAAAAYNAYGEATNTGTALTADQTNKLADLKAKMDAATAAADALDTRLKNLATNIRNNRDELASINVELSAFTAKSAEAAAGAARAWEEYQKKTATALAEDLATANMTNGQKVKYYAAALVTMEALDKQYATQHAAAMAAVLEAEKSGDAERIRTAVAALEKIDAALVANEHAMEQVDGQYTDAYKAQLKEREDAEKKSLEQIQNFEEQFIGDIIQKHESLHNMLKDIWNEIYDDFVKMIEQMIVKSALFGTLNKEIASIFQGAGGAASGAPGDANSYTAALGGGQSGVINIGAVAGQSILGNDGVPINLAQVGGQTVLPSATSSAGAGGAAGIAGLSGVGGLLSILGASGIAGSLIGSAEGGGTHSENGAIGGVVGGGLAALGLGIAGATTGGLAGIIAGIGPALALLGPVGWAGLAAGAVGGALLGGAFGNSDNNATDEPDVYEPSYGTGTSYGQFVSNFNGAPGQFNGTTIQPANQYNTGLGGVSESQEVLAQLKQIEQEGAAAPPALQAIATQLQGLIGNSSSANPFGIASESQGMFTLNSGQQVSVQQYMQLMSQFQNDVGGTSASSTPVYSISQLYPNYNQIGNPQLTGTQSTTTTATGTQTTFTPVTPSAGSTTPTTTPANVTINIPGGMVISPDSADSVALMISQALQRLDRGLIPGSTRFNFSNGAQ